VWLIFDITYPDPKPNPLGPLGPFRSPERFWNTFDLQKKIVSISYKSPTNRSCDLFPFVTIFNLLNHQKLSSQEQVFETKKQQKVLKEILLSD
jgi:hypothetical protein